MTIDKLEVRIKGRMFVDKKLGIGDSVRVVIEGSVEETKVDDNHDGTVNYCAIVRPFPPNADVKLV